MRTSRNVYIGAFGVLVLSLSAFAQERNGNAAGQPPPGISIHVTLKSDISTKYSKVGDPVELEVGRAATEFNGHGMQTVLGEHSLLKGTVTMVRKAGKGQTAAVAIRLAETHSQDGTTSLNVTLVNPVRIMHDSAVIEGNGMSREVSQGNVSTGTMLSPLDEVIVSQDSTLGDVLSSKHDFFLVKKQTELAVVIR